MIDKLVANIRKSNRLVAGGMFFFNSPGHMLAESDYLLRKILVDPKIRQRSPIVFLAPTPFATVIGDILRALGVSVVIDPNAPHIVREIQLFHPDLILDVGFAHFKLTTPPAARGPVCTSSNLEFAWALHRDELTAQWIRVYKLWNATRGQLPLLDGLSGLPYDPKFQELLLRGRFAVLQIKNAIFQGTDRLLPADFFEPTLEILRDHGYAIILAGREPMPDVFKRFDVFDYPASSFVSPKNDFSLFKHASLGVVSPSGAGYFCDALGIPSIQYAPWTLQPHPAETTIMLPSRIRRKGSAAALTFTQQIAAFLENYDEVKGPGCCFNENTLEEIPPSAADLCAGTRELLDLGIRESLVAQGQAAKVRELDKGGMWESTSSTIASSFLTNHPEYLA